MTLKVKAQGRSDGLPEISVRSVFAALFRRNAKTQESDTNGADTDCRLQQVANRTPAPKMLERALMMMGSVVIDHYCRKAEL